MKKLLVLILSLGLLLGSSMGALAKGKPADTGGNGKGKEVVTQEVVNDQEQSTEEEAVVTDEKGKEEAKALREQIKLERMNALKDVLKNAGATEEESEDVVEEYQPAKGVFKVKGQHPVFDVPPVIKAGRTLIPVRAIMNGLGAEVSWDAETQKVIVTRDGKTIEIFLGSQEVLVDGVAVTIDVPASMIANRVFVPIRFISEALGDPVVYDPKTGDVIVGEDSEEETTEEATTEEGTTAEDAVEDTQEETQV
ncbi:MAG: copper amine oxidase N-terminal domain-containing protein [Bacillota bacterium]